MAVFRDRVCATCGDVEYTASLAVACRKCFEIAKSAPLIKQEEQLLTELGYTDISLVGKNKHGKREWQFSHECGTIQTWVYGNILKRIKLDPNTVPCSYCGGQRRSKNGTAQSAENRKIKNPVGWIDYRSVVRRLTENVYAKHKDEINPLGLKRGKGPNDYHLDHIVSIAQCWEMGLEPEVVACKENLQMLTSFDNISKGRK